MSPSATRPCNAPTGSIELTAGFAFATGLTASFFFFTTFSSSLSLPLSTTLRFGLGFALALLAAAGTFLTGLEYTSSSSLSESITAFFLAGAAFLTGGDTFFPLATTPASLSSESSVIEVDFLTAGLATDEGLLDVPLSFAFAKASLIGLALGAGLVTGLSSSESDGSGTAAFGAGLGRGAAGAFFGFFTSNSLRSRPSSQHSSQGCRGPLTRHLRVRVRVEVEGLLLFVGPLAARLGLGVAQALGLSLAIVVKVLLQTSKASATQLD